MTLTKLVGLAAVCLWACHGACVAAAQDVVNGEAGRRLDQAVQRSTLGQFWGAVLVARDGQILLAKGYGLADEQLRPVTADSLFDIGSVTKSFTAAALLRLEMEGKLSTDDPIERHLDAVPADKRGITIHQVMTHSAGITDGADTGDAAELSDDREAFAAWILAQPLRSKPGTAHLYSNMGYFLLAAIVERASGERYEEYVAGHILKPAGMSGSACMGGPVPDRARLTARQDRDWTINGDAASWPYASTWGYRGAGGIVSSARDMYAWDRALRGDEVLAEPRRKKYFTPALAGYACGWNIGRTSRGRVASHSGGVRGYGTWVERWLDQDAVVVVLTNGLNNPVRMGEILRGELFPETASRAMMTMRIGTYAQNQWGQPQLPADLQVRASRAGAAEFPELTVAVIDPKHAEPALELKLSPGAADALAAQIEEAVAQVGKAGADAGSRGVRLELYTGVYQVADDGVLTRDDPRLTVQAKAGMMHPEEGGDQRVLVYVTDPARSFMPVFLKLEAGSAENLSADLRKLLGP